MVLRPAAFALLLLGACFEDEAGECDPTQPPAPWEDRDGDGYVGEDDCDDASFASNPSARETCDGIDNNCDGSTDGPDAADAQTLYADEDGDGYGDDAATVTSCESLASYATQGGDCDDGDPAFNPGAVEDDCTDPNDYNCDGSSGGEDADGDGYFACEDCDDGDLGVHPEAVDVWYDGVDADCAEDDDYDQDGDGYVPDEYAGLLTEGVADSGALPAGDCDDEDAGVNPAAEDLPDDGADQNRDGADAALCDRDEDGYEDAASCGGLDCDDTDDAVNPGAAETCNTVDDDCDGLTDDGDDSLTGASTWYEDSDGDGYGDPASAVDACSAPTGTVSNGDDCDDTDALVNPDATETCNSVDDNCDGLADDDDPSVTGTSTFYTDADGDGYGDPFSPRTACAFLVGTVVDATDCDDTDASINPGESETVGDEADANCDGAETCYADADADGYADDAGTTVSSADTDCADTGEASGSDPRTDCDDADASVNPGESEVCDPSDADEDCDGLADNADSSTIDFTTWYRDADADGYGDPASTRDACSVPSGYTSDSADCDDSDAGVNPGASDLVGDGEDSDCDGVELCYADDDGDAYADESGATVSSADADCADAGEADSADPRTDCDDADASVNPGETETVGDEVDANCDGTETCYVDADLDGYAADSGATRSSTDLDCNDSGEASDSDPLTDCDDTDADVSPGGTEVANDGTDTDCDGYDPATDSVWTLDACSADGGISLVVKSNGAFGACVVTGTDFYGDDPSCSWRPPLLVEADGTQHEIRSASTTNDLQLSDAEATSKIVLSSLPDLDIEIDQIVTGSTLTQTYTFTNNGATDLDFDVYRTADPDLDYGFQDAYPYTSSSPEPQPAVGSCPAGGVEYGGRCCPDFDPTCTSDLYNTRKGYAGFNVPWEIDGDPAACSYDRLADASGGYCVAMGDGGGDATYDGYRMIMGQSSGSAIHAHLGFALGFYVQERQEASTVRFVLQDDGSDEVLSDLPQDVPAGDDLPGLDWDYAFGVGGAGDLGILLSWQLSIPAGGSATLVTTTNWYPAVSCP